MTKNGSDHVASLRDGREVYIDGERADDVTTHPAFRNAVASAGALYDMQASPEFEELLTYESPGTGDRVNRAWQLPKTYEDLANRRRALIKWQEPHLGFLGRSPDHVASAVAAMYMSAHVYDEIDPARGAAVRDYYRHARDSDSFLTYTIVNPQTNKKQATHEQDADLTLAVVDEDAEGLTVRGAKMLATSGVLANELFVSGVQPLQQGDERHAVSFAVPMNAKGLQNLARRSYEASATSTFDHPVSSRFDETDGVIFFDDVKVPWDRVFVNQDVDLLRKQFHGTPVHVYQNYQCNLRLIVKLKFLAAIAHRITEINSTTDFPQVREALGQLAAEVGMVEALIHGMEVKGHQYGEYFVPDPALLYSSQVLTQQLYPKVIHTLRELSGGGVIMLPSSEADFSNPTVADKIRRVQKSAVASPDERVKLFKLAWDVIGSEFASRHVQYEMFYNGAAFVVRGNAYRTFDWDDSRALLDDFLGSYDGPLE
ncbi:4-hydroxyphenylacetate 3-hydroxylase family protein [Ruicaihuangia caeni]|uniref:4-hydroxyphenylacetate 3-hydroxylase N-terminal domain-containing protein n=1 Tax=Ruicaihuangia caeni TaxID=3042517 RepID=A0AAW6T6F7_9MICO|nr:4-hydroxyphenylacetate 3-hydroxylase N-terminal domain-containing protein [Klugiella sp. YN-L-19]MDI2099367.1 4-hydroxyphenylacetate 3-hydroxylase N-terminal domain-containing protein [Klugiella sp. YN-L-19]